MLFCYCLKKRKWRPRNVKCFFLKSLRAGLRALVPKNFQKQFSFDLKLLTQSPSHNPSPALQLGMKASPAACPRSGGYTRPEGEKWPALRPVLPPQQCTGPLPQQPQEGREEPYLSMNLPNPNSSILARQVVSVGFISQPMSSLICKGKRKVGVHASRQGCLVDFTVMMECSGFVRPSQESPVIFSP